MASSVSIQGPFSIIEVFVNMMSFVEASDICKSACVCKLWKQFADDLATSHFFWSARSESKGIPMVSNENGPRNYLKDFRVISPKTVCSGENCRKIYGEPVGRVVRGKLIGGEVPCIREEIF